MSERHIAPRLAIGAILGFVAIYDYFAPEGELISDEVDRLRESPKTGILTHFVIDSFYHHLKRDVPPETDPIHLIGSIIK